MAALPQFRVKWKGYELDPDEWTLEDGLMECTALDEWQVPRGCRSAILFRCQVAPPSRAV